MFQLIVWIVSIFMIAMFMRSCDGKTTHTQEESKAVDVKVYHHMKKVEESNREEKYDESLTPEEKLYTLTGEKIDPVDSH